MYQQNTLQMEWCLNCHRNPAKNLRPTSEIYNMAWKDASELKPVWCAATDAKTGTPTAQSVSCTTTNPTPGAGSSEQASLHLIPAANALVTNAQTTDAPTGTVGGATGELYEVHQPGGAGRLPGAALQDPLTAGAFKLRGMPPMKKSRA